MVNQHFLRLFYSVLGGVAWTVHFMLLYGIAEFGCVLGQTWVGAVIVLLTILFTLLALFGAWKCYRGKNFGLISNLIFAFIILFQAMPVVFFKGSCV